MTLFFIHNLSFYRKDFSCTILNLLQIIGRPPVSEFNISMLEQIMAAIYSFHPIRLCKYFFALVANINIYVGALFLDILDISWIWILQSYSL